MPMPRKSGGRAEYPAMKYGAGGGEGRLEKIAVQKRSNHKDGGFAELKAGAGSGLGRLEKIKLQEHAR